MVSPGTRVVTTELGVYNVLVWAGSGRYAGQDVRGGDAHLDELLITHSAAVTPLVVENTGTDDLVIFKFFGPDINPEAPMSRVWS